MSGVIVSGELDDAHEILPGLWLGNEEFSNSLMELRDRSITHILTVGNALELYYPMEFSYLLLNAWDWEVEDLLRYLTSAFHFIDHARKNNGIVFVHCRAGVSRSATIVIAYIMWKHGLSSDKALKKVKEIRPVHPNSGFRYQLKVLDKVLDLPLNDNRKKHFHPIDEINLRLSLHPDSIGNRASRLALEHSDGGIETFSYFRCLDNEEILQDIGAEVYHCGECHYPLFSDCNVMDADVDKRHVSELSMKNLLKPKPNPCDECCKYHTYHFIEPMKWMLQSKNSNEIIEESAGNIHCPNCDRKLGDFNWQLRVKCKSTNCLSSIPPRFQILKSKCIQK